MRPKLVVWSEIVMNDKMKDNANLLASWFYFSVYSWKMIHKFCNNERKLSAHEAVTASATVACKT